MRINEKSKAVRAGSHGRGLWEHDLVATVAGVTFIDDDGNGIRDAGEPALGGWTIILTDSTGKKSSAITTVSGHYYFSGLPAGTYTFDEVALNGWNRTSPARTIQLVSGEARLNADFGNQVANPNACVPPTAAITGWWRLDETFGPTAADRGGIEQNHGTRVGDPAGVPGKVDHALHLDGTSQYVEVPSMSEVNVGAGDFSIDAWIRTTSSDIRTFVDKRTPSIRGYSFYVVYGRLGFQMADRSGIFSSCSGTNSETPCTNWSAPEGSVNVADGQWHHVAVTIDRDDRNGGVFYVDGAIVFIFDPTIRNLSLDNSAPMHIGYTAHGNTFWNGDIDEVGLFKRALTPIEIHAMYKAGAFGKCVPGGCSPRGCV